MRHCYQGNICVVGTVAGTTISVKEVWAMTYDSLAQIPAAPAGKAGFISGHDFAFNAAHSNLVPAKSEPTPAYLTQFLAVWVKLDDGTTNYFTKSLELHCSNSSLTACGD